jgi:hypothetical protein
VTDILTPSSMRVGDEITVTGTPLNAGGHPAVGLNPSWTQAGTPDDIITITPNESDQFEATITAVQSGTDTATLHVDDTFLDEHTASLPITVLDASRFDFWASDPTACTLVWRTTPEEGSVLYVRPDSEATATFTLHIRGRDSRSDRPFPTYALSDGPNLTTDNQRVLFGVSPGPTSADEEDVLVTLASSGADVIHATGVTDATSASIAGNLKIRVDGMTSVSLSYPGSAKL